MTLSPAVKTRLLLVCGAIAGPLFTLAWLVAGATRPDYDPLRHPISSLSIGACGWTRTANFLLTGIAFVVMFIVTNVGFAGVAPLVDNAGLFQRLMLTIGWLWLTLLALYMLGAPAR
jgi:hypothetical protein